MNSTAEENNPTPSQEAFSSPYATPHIRNRFSRVTHAGAPENCASSDNHIPEKIVRDDTTSTAIDNNRNTTATRGVGDSVPSRHLDNGRNSSRESEPGTGRNLGWNYHRENGKKRDTCDWDASTSSVSVVTLQDETEVQRCDDTRQNQRGSNYSLNDILDGDIDELRLSIQNLESTRQEKKRSSRNLQCSLNEVFEEPVKMPGQAQSGHNCSVERYSYPGYPLVKSGPTSEKQLMVSDAVDVDGAAKKPQNCENTAVLLLPDKQKQLDAALQKIEGVINNGSTDEIRTNNDVECQRLHEDHTVIDTNTEDVTSDKGLAWNSDGKDRRFGDLRQEEEEEEEERALLQSDSQTDVSESDQNDEISALVGDDNTSEEDRFVSQLNALTPQTSQQEREKTPVSQSFQTECLHPDNSTNEEEKQCIELSDCQATMEAKLFSKNDRKLDRRTSESGKMTIKSEDKISLIRRHSLTNDNLSNDTKKETAMSKDMVTALTAYFEEVHAEHCSGCQHSTPKSRSSSFASRSSSDSKESSSFDDNDAGNTCSGIRDHTGEFRTIRHQRSAAKTAEETDVQKDGQIHESGSEKTLIEASSEETHAPRTKPLESELVIGGGCVQPSQNAELDHRPVDSTPDFITPVDLQTEITASQGISQHNETSSLLQEHLEQALQDSGHLQNLQEEDGSMSAACTNNIINMSAMVTSCEIDDQTHCQTLSSTGERASPLQVNYVRTCSLKSFWDVVTPPSSPRVEKLDEGKIFQDIPDHGNAIADKTDKAQIHGSSDSKDDCEQSKSDAEEPLEREITPVSTEDGEDHSQNSPPLPLPRQPSSGMADRNKIGGDFEDDRWYGIPHKEHALFKCELPKSQQQPEALRHEFAESLPAGKTLDSGGNEAEHTLDCIQSEMTELSGIDEEQKEASSGGTLTEKDIRKYQLGCHDHGGHQQGCHDDYSGNDAAEEDHLWFPMEQTTEMVRIFLL